MESSGFDGRTSSRRVGELHARGAKRCLDESTLMIRKPVPIFRWVTSKRETNAETPLTTRLWRRLRARRWLKLDWPKRLDAPGWVQPAIGVFAGLAVFLLVDRVGPLPLLLSAVLIGFTISFAVDLWITRLGTINVSDQEIREKR